MYTERLIQAATVSVTKFQEVLADLIDSDEENALKSAASLFHNPFFTGIVKNHFNADLKSLHSTTSKSYYHENGFDKTVLFEGRNFKIRLHRFYPAKQKMAMENVHDHRWMFASAILQGNLSADFFQESLNEGEKLIKHIYHSNKSNGVYDVDRIGTRKIKRINTSTYSKGDTYLLHTDELHRICRVGNQGATTAIVTGKPRREDCKLYSKKEFTSELKTLMRLDEGHISSLINSIAA